MGKILDIIIGNKILFAAIIIVLVAVLVFLIISIFKSLKPSKRKIPIYEEIDENAELKEAKEEDIIEKPNMNEKKTDKEERKVEEETIDKSVEEETDDNQGEAKEKDEEKKDIFEETEVEETEEQNEPVEEVEEEPYFDDATLREELEKIDDKEIEERIDEEHKKNIDEEIKDNDNEEIKEILTEMKDNKEVDPEEVVRNFEEEQEAQSIISYQELVNVVKNRENDFDDELESRPLTTVSDFIKKDKSSTVEPEENVLAMIEKLDKNSKKKTGEDLDSIEELVKDKKETLKSKVEEIETLEVPVKKEKKSVKQDSLAEIPDEGKFKKTEVISPVYGRIKEKNKIDYPKVEKFSRGAKKKTDDQKLDDELMQAVMPDFSSLTNKVKETEKIELFDDLSDKKETKKAVKEINKEEEIESLSAISKNEDFLKALKDFRDSL